MPLLDHFHPPLSIQRHWQGFHSAWASTIARQLNELLPPRYFAEPNVQVGGRLEIDVAALKESGDRRTGGVGTLRWAPAQPTLILPVEAAPRERFSVQIFSNEEGPRLVAAVELVSPANKDRSSHRSALVTKCAAYLQDEISLVLVDIVSSRGGNLHAELVQAITAPYISDEEAALFAAAYRTVAGAAPARLEVWLQTLHMGGLLPTLPLWLDEFQCLPLDLESTYEATRAALRL